MANLSSGNSGGSGGGLGDDGSSDSDTEAVQERKKKLQDTRTSDGSATDPDAGGSSPSPPGSDDLHGGQASRGGRESSDLGSSKPGNSSDTTDENTGSATGGGSSGGDGGLEDSQPGKTVVVSEGGDVRNAVSPDTLGQIDSQFQPDIQASDLRYVDGELQFAESGQRKVSRARSNALYGIGAAPRAPAPEDVRRSTGGKLGEDLTEQEIERENPDVNAEVGRNEQGGFAVDGRYRPPSSQNQRVSTGGHLGEELVEKEVEADNNQAVDVEVSRDEQGGFELEQNEQFGDALGENAPGVERDLEQFAEKHKDALDPVTKPLVDMAGDPNQNTKLVGPAGSVSLDTNAAYYAAKRADEFNPAAIPIGAAEFAEGAYYVANPALAGLTKGNTAKEGRQELATRAGAVGAAGFAVGSDYASDIAVNPAKGIGEGLFAGAAFAAGGAAKTAAFRGASRVSAPDIETPSLGKYTPDVRVERAPDAPPLDVNVGLNPDLGKSADVRDRVSDLSVPDVDVDVNPRQRVSDTADRVTNAPDAAKDELGDLAGDIKQYRQQVGRTLRDKPAAARDRVASSAGSARDQLRGQLIGLNADAALAASRTRSALANPGGKARQATRRVARDTREFGSRARDEFVLQRETLPGRARDAAPEFSRPSFDFDFGSDRDFGLPDTDEISGRARGEAFALGLRAESAANSVRNVPANAALTGRRAKRDLADIPSNLGLAARTRPRISDYTLRVDIGKPGQQSTPFFDVEDADDIDAEVTGDIETFDFNPDDDTGTGSGSPGDFTSDVEDNRRGGQTTVTRKRSRRDVDGEAEGVGREFDGTGDFSFAGGFAGMSAFSDTGFDSEFGAATGPTVDDGEVTAPSVNWDDELGSEFDLESWTGPDLGSSPDLDGGVGIDVDYGADTEFDFDTQLEQETTMESRSPPRRPRDIDLDLDPDGGRDGKRDDGFGFAERQYTADVASASSLVLGDVGQEFDEMLNGGNE